MGKSLNLTMNTLPSLDEICLAQDEIIENQRTIIHDLLIQLVQFRELTKEEMNLMENDNENTR